MKFIAFFEGGDIETARKKVEEFNMLSEKTKNEGFSGGKALSPSYVYANGRGGFQLFEAENVESLAAMAVFYYEDTEFTFRPILELSKIFELKEEIEKASK